MQILASTAFEDSSECTPVQENAGLSKSVAASLLHGDTPPRNHWPSDSAALLSVKDAAKMLKVCARTVYRLCAKAALGHVRLGNTIRFRPEDLERFIEGYRRGAKGSS
jgi:excisionase family DNA binding protein